MGLEMVHYMPLQVTMNRLYGATTDKTSDISVVIIGARNGRYPIYVNLPLRKAVMYPDKEHAVNRVVNTPIDSIAVHFMMTGRSSMSLSKLEVIFTGKEYTEERQRQYA